VCVCVCVCEYRLLCQVDQSLSLIRGVHLSLGLLSVIFKVLLLLGADDERWGAGVETQKNVRGEIGGWGRVPFNEPYAPSLSTIYDGA